MVASCMFVFLYLKLTIFVLAFATWGCFIWTQTILEGLLAL